MAREKTITKSQKNIDRNQRVLVKEACIVLGAVLLGEGIIRSLPFFHPGAFIALGMLLFIIGVLWKNETKKT